jgi:FG-GAP-like repeat
MNTLQASDSEKNMGNAEMNISDGGSLTMARIIGLGLGLSIAFAPLASAQFAPAEPSSRMMPGVSVKDWVAFPVAQWTLDLQDSGTFAGAVGDLDNDGDEDLVTVGQTTLSLSILLNKGRGAFESRETVIFPTQPFYVVAFDVDLDGNLDLAVSGSGLTYILLGHGDGTFEFGEDAPLTGFYWFKAADLTGDGITDLVGYLSGQRSKVRVAPGNGDGTFDPVFEIETNSDQFAAIEVADLDADGINDLIVRGSSNEVRVMLGLGGGAFAPGVNYPARSGVWDIAAVRINGNPNVSIVVIGNLQGRAVFLPGNGDGTLGTRTDVRVEGRPRTLDIGDVDGDGDDDVIVGYTTSSQGLNQATVLEQQIDGSFVVSEVVNVGDGVRHEFLLGDFDGDTISDLVTIDRDANRARVYFGQEDATFDQRQVFSAGQGAAAVVTGDIDNDGQPDLLVANEIDNTITVFLGDTTSLLVEKTVLGTGLKPAGMALGDVDGDGALDLAVAETDSDTFSVFLGMGDGLFAPPTAHPSGGLDPTSVVLSDLNEDGLLDYIVANKGNNVFAVMLADGPGLVGSPVLFSSSTASEMLAAQDMNGDGHMDIVSVGGGFSGLVSVFLGDGVGGFSAPLDHAAGQSPVAVDAADLNGDSVLDLAVANRLGSSVKVLLGNGDGTMSNAANLNGVPGAVSVSIGDVDGDSVLDIVATSQTQNFVNVFPGVGDGSFGIRTQFVVGNSPRGIALLDLDGFGDLDLAVGSSGDGVAEVLLNETHRRLRCSVADFAEPFQVLDFFDVQAFLGAFAGGDTEADLTGDGQIDFFDVQAFLTAFSQGCS